MRAPCACELCCDEKISKEMDSSTSSKDVVSKEVTDFIKIFPSLQIVDDDYSKITKVTINYDLIFS